MKLSALIKELNHVLETCGDLETFVQEKRDIGLDSADIGVCAHDTIWIMPEDDDLGQYEFVHSAQLTDLKEQAESYRKHLQHDFARTMIPIQRT